MPMPTHAEGFWAGMGAIFLFRDVHGSWEAWFMGWFMLIIEGGDDFEVEYSTKGLVQLVEDDTL